MVGQVDAVARQGNRIENDVDSDEASPVKQAFCAEMERDGRTRRGVAQASVPAVSRASGLPVRGSRHGACDTAGEDACAKIAARARSDAPSMLPAFFHALAVSGATRLLVRPFVKVGMRGTRRGAVFFLCEILHPSSAPLRWKGLSATPGAPRQPFSSPHSARAFIASAVAM